LSPTVQRSKIGRNAFVVSERLPGVRSVSLGLWIDRGSRHETAAKAGLSHLYEHMIFKGTRTRSAREIARALEKRGGMLNAFTGKEQICLHAKFIEEDTALAVDVLRDLYENPLFLAQDLEKEKEVVFEEIRATEDNPEESVHESLMQCLFPGHPLGTPIAGSPATISGMRRADLTRIRGRIYGSRVVITAAGGLRHEKLARLFKGLQARPSQNGAARIVCPARGARRLFVRDIHQANMALGFRTGTFVSEEKYALLIFNALLGDGMSSRLFHRIREELGLVYTIYSFMDAFHDTGLFGVFFSTEAEKLPRALNQVLSEIRALCEARISPEELAFAKSFLRGGILLGMENTSNRMFRLARSELYLGRIEPVDQMLRGIDRVTLADIRKLSRKYFTGKRLCLAAAVPPGTMTRRQFGKISL
jgi:predicted Zn-dependent peptidase